MEKVADLAQIMRMTKDVEFSKKGQLEAEERANEVKKRLQLRSLLLNRLPRLKMAKPHRKSNDSRMRLAFQRRFEEAEARS